jgi:hypothetical protein
VLKTMFLSGLLAGCAWLSHASAQVISVPMICTNAYGHKINCPPPPPPEVSASARRAYLHALTTELKDKQVANLQDGRFKVLTPAEWHADHVGASEGWCVARTDEYPAGKQRFYHVRIDEKSCPLSYDGALELFSGPLMQQYRSQWSFGAEQQGEDGVTYNLQFEGYRDALHAWRYPDFTRHISFIADALERTVEQEMRVEAQYLQHHRAARNRLKTLIEGPDPALDRIIRSVRESRGSISGKLRTEYPILERPEIAEDVVRAIREEFPWSPINPPEGE